MKLFVEENIRRLRRERNCLKAVTEYKPLNYYIIVPVGEILRSILGWL